MPVSSLIEIFLSITLGGCVGWITNAIAVNMLFKKYWKWGGVIEARYQEFITNMSQLVETDLVNGKTLLDEFNSEPFKAGVRQWIETILQKALPENSGAVRLEAIPGIETTIHQLIGLLETIEPGLFAPLFRELGNQQVKNLLSKKHYEYIIEKNVHTLMSDAETYQYRLRHIISLFLEEKRIRDLISERALRQIGKNCGDIIRNIDFSRFDEASNTAYEQFLAAMDIDRLISELEQTLKSMRFANFVNNPRNFSRELLTNLVEFTQTAEGQKVLCKIIDDFFTAARHVDLKVADVVNPSILGGIHRFCNEKMPGIIDKIIAFIRNTQAEIEAIVNTTVDEQLDKTLVGKIGKLLKNIFIENLAHTVDVIGRIIHAVEEHGQKAGEDISQRIITLLQTKTIGEIVGMIQDSGLVKAQSIVDIINFNLKTLPGKDVNMLDELLEKRIGDIFGSIPLAIIKTDWLPLLFTAVKQKYLFTDRFKEDMCPIVSAKIQEMAQIPLSDM
ncbi:MAG: DUF445 family protein, partial [Spirochaetaceae bacterium]|nr:DUF445 family protein [Spirochaetaceae bacterium]